jgi:hypothetical protein
MDRGGLAIVAMRQFPRGSFFENVRHLKDIFRDFEAFLKIMIIFEDISEKLKLFTINVRDLKELRGFLNTFLVELRLFKVM